MIIGVKKFSMITLSDNEGRLLNALGQLGVIQLRKLDEAAFAGFKEATSEEAREYENLHERLGSLQTKLSVSFEEGKSDYAGFDRVKTSIKELRASVEEYEREVAKLEEKLVEAERRLAILAETKQKLQILRAQAVNPGDIGDFNHIFSIAGTIDTLSLDALRVSLEVQREFTFRDAPISANESFLFVAGMLESKPILDKQLAKTEFRPIQLPSEVPAAISDAVQWADRESSKFQEEIQLCKKEWNKLRQDFTHKGWQLQSDARYSLDLSLAQLNLLRSRMLAILQGWVPKDRIKHLNAFLMELNEQIGGTLEFSYEDPSPSEEIPTVMKNPRLFTAYETLTRQYGYPDARESDPTIMSTILWITMFGIMFPDFGEGLVIVGLGVIFAFVLKKNLMGINFGRLGKLMIGLGISAIVFGLLAGEFFLIEIPPLWPGLTIGWARYPINVVWLIKISIFFGIAQITLGLLVSIRNHLKRGERLEAFLGERGVAGLITFWGIVIVAFCFLGIHVFPGIRFPYLQMNALKQWPIAMPVAGVALIAIKPVLSGEGATMGIGAIIEVLISSLANMLSYARIAGFSIAHAAFALVVAELLRSNPILGIGLGLIFLNCFALTLELMVVMIQALRLLYYEFSTKFFSGTGIPFAPFKIRA